jgi:hypothetical protein
VIAVVVMGEGLVMGGTGDVRSSHSVVPQSAMGVDILLDTSSTSSISSIAAKKPGKRNLTSIATYKKKLNFM